MTDENEPKHNPLPNHDGGDELIIDLVNIQQRKNLETEVIHEVEPIVVPNREFDIPEFKFSKLQEDQIYNIREGIDKAINWLVDIHPIKDKFGTSTLGDGEREIWRNKFIAEYGALGKEVWEELDGRNKFRINMMLYPALNIKNIISSLRPDANSLESFLDDFSELYESISPYESVYETMTYEERIKFIHKLEDKVVDFLKELHKIIN